jgi:hypothetical protein
VEYGVDVFASDRLEQPAKIPQVADDDIHLRADPEKVQAGHAAGPIAQIAIDLGAK